MTLSQKTALIVALFATANVAIGYSIHRSVVAPEFSDLEQREVEKNVKRASEAIQREAFLLDALAHEDTASWDATYEFAKSRRPRLFESNLSPALLRDNRDRLGGRRGRVRRGDLGPDSRHPIRRSCWKSQNFLRDRNGTNRIRSFAAIRESIRSTAHGDE